MKKYLKLTVLLITSFLTLNTSQGEDSNLIIDISFSKSYIVNNGYYTISANGKNPHFHVVVENKGKVHLTFPSERGFPLRFEMKSESGDQFTAKQTSYIHRGPYIPVSLSPGEKRVFDIEFTSKRWEGFPNKGGKKSTQVEMVAILERQEEYAKGPNDWHGKLNSKPVKVSLGPWKID